MYSGKKLFNRYSYLLNRLEGMCVICGELITNPLSITREHIVPISKGGTNSEDNVLPAHYRCNNIKREGSLIDAILFMQNKKQTMGKAFNKYINKNIPKRSLPESCMK